MRWKEFRRNVNTYSGKVNTDSGKSQKVFILGRNYASATTVATWLTIERGIQIKNRHTGIIVETDLIQGDRQASVGII